MSYAEFLQRATDGLATIGARPLLSAQGLGRQPWTEGWDRILAADGPGAATLYAFTECTVPESVSERVERLARGLAASGMLSRGQINLVVIAATRDLEAVSRLRRALSPRTYFPGLRPFAWVADLSSGKVSAGRGPGQPDGRELVAAAAAGESVDSETAHAMREGFVRQQQAFTTMMSGRQPVATYVLIALNVAMFLLVSLAGGQYSDNLQRYGALVPELVIHGQWWRMVSAMFLHAGLTHLFFNMTSLFVVGSLAERLYGSGKFLGIYLGSGLLASAAGLISSLIVGDTLTPHVGASGAIFGIAGALMTLRFQRSDVVPASLRRRVSSSMVLLVAINFVVLAFTPNIDNAAHVGGLVGGALLSFALPLTRTMPEVTPWP